MAGTFQPLSRQFPIVDENGQPTEYFIRWAQQRQIDIGEGINGAEAEKLINDWAKSRNVLAGDGLAGGGALDQDVTLSLDAGLGDLSDVDFSVSPTNDQVMVYDEASGLWKPADQSGGGGSVGSYRGPWQPPVPPGVILFNTQVIPTEYNFRKAGSYQSDFGFINAPDAVAGTTYSLTFPGSVPVSGGAWTGFAMTVTATATDNVFRFRAWVQLETGYDGMVVYKNGTRVIWETGVQSDYKEYTVTLDAPGVPVDISIGVYKDGVGAEGFQNVRVSRIVVPNDDPPGDYYTYSDTVLHNSHYWFCALSGTTAEPGVGIDWLPFNQDNGGGGGGGGDSIEAPFTRPTLSSFPSKNPNTGTIEEFPLGVMLSAPGATSNVNQITRACTPVVGGAGGWQATARLRVYFPLMNWPMAGLLVRDSSSGRLVMQGLGFDAVAGINRNQYINDSTWDGVSGTVPWQDHDFWMRVKTTPTQRIWYLSTDGYFWQQIAVEGWNNYLTANEVGVYLNPNTGNAPPIRNRVAMSVLSWQVEPLS